MIDYAVVFFVIALIAGIIGFGGVGGPASSIAITQCILFVVFGVVTLILNYRGVK